MSGGANSSSESLLDNNRLRKIDIPLIHYGLNGLDKLARAFARKVNPTAPNERLFIIAARIAYDPPGLDRVDCTAYEKEAVLRARSLSFWKQPKALQATVVCLCFSAIVQGWVQSVLNGANQTMPTDLGLADSNYNWKTSSSLWIFSVLNAITYLTAGLFGCWISDPIQSIYLGRRGAIFAAGCLCFASAIGCAFCHSWKALMVCRALLGLGLGAKASVTPIFCAEVSPNHLRGALVMNWQLMDAVGIFLGYSVNLVLSYTRFYNWRVQIGSACIPAACLIALVWTVPESPRWLLKQNDFPAAFSSMCALRESPLQAAIELLYANEQLQTEVSLLPPKSTNVEDADCMAEHIEDVTQKPIMDRFQVSVAKTNYWVRIWQLFRNKRTRRATVAAAIVMIGQQLCGINILAFYGTILFTSTDDPRSTSHSPLWMCWGTGLSNLLFTFPAYYRIDTRGRRFLLLTSYPGMILCMLAACLSFFSNDDSVRLGLLGTFSILFVLFYAFGQGPVAFAYASEVFPLLNREAGMSFAVFVNLFGAGILTLFVPQSQVNQDRDTTHGISDWQSTQIRLLAAFTILNVVAFILIFLFVPETAGAAVRKTEGQLNYMYLEELNYIFGVPTWVHINYQFVHVIPVMWQMVRYQVGRPFSAGRVRPQFEKMYIWAQNRETQDSDGNNDGGITGGSRNLSSESTTTESQWEQQGQGLQQRHGQTGDARTDQGQSYVLDDFILPRRDSNDSWPLEFR